MSDSPKKFSLLTAAFLCGTTFVLGLLVGQMRSPAVPVGATPADSAANAPTVLAPAPLDPIPCSEVQRLAEAGDVDQAIARFQTCLEPNKDAALKTIDEAVLKVLEVKGCAAWSTIRAASAIGARSARQPYVDKGCGPRGQPVR